MKITPRAVHYAVQYVQQHHKVVSIRESIMLAMEYSGYVQQAMKEEKTQNSKEKRGY
jgi:hypothetical protein